MLVLNPFFTFKVFNKLFFAFKLVNCVLELKSKSVIWLPSKFKYCKLGNSLKSIFERELFDKSRKAIIELLEKVILFKFRLVRFTSYNIGFPLKSIVVIGLFSIISASIDVKSCKPVKSVIL